MSAVSTVIAVICMALPIAEIAMGAVHLNNCPAQRFIPIYLVVFGAFMCFLLLLVIMDVWTQDGEGESPIILSGVRSLVGIFLFVWFITGNVWIYGLHNKYSTNTSDSNYCDNTFYLFAFWVTTLTYILMGVMIATCYVFCICVTCCSFGASE